MDPITSSELFKEDPELAIEELEDGSALVDIPSEEDEEISDHFANLAETLDQFTLNSLSSDLLDLIEKDKKAREKRDEQYEEGIKRTGLGDDAPGGATFEGASRVVHPVLAEGCVDFAARAIKELFPTNGPVKTKIFGESDLKKLEKAQKKRDYLNFLLTQRMKSYRDEKEIMLTQLPLGGSQYEKYYVDPVKRTYTMEFVPIDRVLLPFAATSFYDTPRLTHIIDLTRQKFDERVASGFYLATENLVDSTDTPEESKSETATDKVEGLEGNYNIDGLRTIYEIVLDSAIEDDDEVRPYVVHIDAPTEKILAIYRNWDEDDEHFNRLDWWVEDKFIPWRGIYGIGLPHLIGSLAGALTGAIRALLDSAHINNSPGAVKLKGGRGSGQNIVVEQTEVKELDAPPGVDDIRKLIMPMPFNPPSTVLMQLLDWLMNQAKGVVATAEERIADASNSMPVGTALALIEQGSQVFSSIHARLHASQGRGFEILCRLINKYPNVEELARFDLVPEDFEDNDDIQPVSDPNIFSEAQRYAQLQEQIKVMATFPQLNWNREEFARRALELLRTDGIETILPKTPEPLTSNPVDENYQAVIKGSPLKASQEQDHIAHLREHLRFIMDPMFGNGPSVSGQQLQGILAHCQQHLMFIYTGISQEASRIHTENTGEEGDIALAKASEFAAQELAKIANQLVPALQQAAQVVQGKMPQPQTDPAVQKTFEAAMAEINRKAQADEKANQLALQKLNNEQNSEAQKVNAEQMAEAQRIQKEAEQQEFDRRLANMREAIKLSSEEETRKLETKLALMDKALQMLQSERDLTTRQETELQKNYEDNMTELSKTQMHLEAETASPEALEIEVNSRPDIPIEILEPKGLLRTTMAQLQALIRKVAGNE